MVTDIESLEECIKLKSRLDDLDAANSPASGLDDRHRRRYVREKFEGRSGDLHVWEKSDEGVVVFILQRLDIFS